MAVVTMARHNGASQLPLSLSSMAVALPMSVHTGRKHVMIPLIQLLCCSLLGLPSQLPSVTLTEQSLGGAMVLQLRLACVVAMCWSAGMFGPWLEPGVSDSWRELKKKPTSVTADPNNTWKSMNFGMTTQHTLIVSAADGASGWDSAGVLTQSQFLLAAGFSLMLLLLLLQLKPMYHGSKEWSGRTSNLINGPQRYWAY